MKWIKNFFFIYILITIPGRLGKFSLNLGNFLKCLWWPRVLFTWSTQQKRTIYAFHINQCTAERFAKVYPKKLFKLQSRLNKRKHSFLCRVTDIWNALPESVINCETVKKFEKKLDEFWSNSEKIYNYRAHILSTTSIHNVNLQISDDKDEGVEPQTQAE